MMREGQGLVAPIPVEFTLTAAELAWLKRESARRKALRNYAGRSDTWGRGLSTSGLLRGFVCELAAIRFLNARCGLNLQLDTEDRPRGNGQCDIRVFGHPFQVKGRSSRGHLLVRREADNGKLLPIHWHVCISATWGLAGEEDPLTGTLDGWIRRRDIALDGEFAPARRGDHMNLEVPDERLESMDSLVDFVSLLRDWKELP